MRAVAGDHTFVFGHTRVFAASDPGTAVPFGSTLTSHSAPSSHSYRFSTP